MRTMMGTMTVTETKCTAIIRIKAETLRYTFPQTALHHYDILLEDKSELHMTHSLHSVGIGSPMLSRVVITKCASTSFWRLGVSIPPLQLRNMQL